MDSSQLVAGQHGNTAWRLQGAAQLLLALQRIKTASSLAWLLQGLLFVGCMAVGCTLLRSWTIHAAATCPMRATWGML